MYQLGLITITPEVPRMSVTLGANRWASRVVVVLQLAAWTAVGIVLLQKGVSSLQKSAIARNVTQLNYTETVANLMMKRVADESSSSSSEEDEEKEEEEEDWLGANIRGDNPDGGEDYRENGNPAVDPIFSRQTANHLSGVSRSREHDGKAIVRNSDKTLNEDFPPKIVKGKKSPEYFEKEPIEFPDAVQSTATSPAAKLNDVADEKYNKTSEARRKLKPLVGKAAGAAAAAVAMVAVGAVMLVLGPAVIILRALDERRQERRFLKLSAQDDLPPSYEQATLMDEAPRYSTLSLNTIMGSSVTGEASTSASSNRSGNGPDIEEV